MRSFVIAIAFLFFGAGAAMADGKKLDDVMKGWYEGHADLMKRWSNIKKD